MSWLGYFPWSEGLKKRACIYLLQRYLGQFLEEKLTLDQLTVDLYNGTGRVTQFSLDVQALNELGEQQYLPLEFVDGYVAEMSVSIPWSALLHEASFVEVTGLRLTVQPRQRTETATSMFESMWSSMTSSMQLAQECLQQDSANSNTSPQFEAIEAFAQTIDSILRRVKVRFIDTVIRMEHVPLDSETGVAIELCIKNLEYSDEAGSDPSTTTMDPSQSQKGYIVSAFTTKRFYLEGVTIHTDEFPSRARTFSRSVMTTSRGSTPDSKVTNINKNNNSDGQFSPTQNSQPLPNLIKSISESNPIIFAKLAGRQEIRLKLKQGEGVSGPKVDLEVTLGSFTVFLSPRQVHILMELRRGLASPDMEDVSNVPPRPCTEKPMANSDFNRVERELLHQIHPSHGLRTMDLRRMQGWSTASIEDSDNEDEFLPMKPPGAASSMNDSVTSNNVSMDGSISVSSISSRCSTTMPKQKKYRSSVDTDSSVETSQFHVRVSSIAVVLLHEDILTVDIESYGLTKASTEQMKATAEDFFKKLGVYAAGGYGNKDFEKAPKMFVDACQLSHIRLLAAPLIIEGSEKTTAQFSQISGSLTLASLELVECLVDTFSSNPTIEFIELLTFLKDNVTSHGFTNKTDFRMRFKYTEKAVRLAQVTKFTYPRTEIDIQLEPCQSEIDVTIVDRICAVLNPPPICTCSSSTASKDTNNQQTLFYQAVESPSLLNLRTDIKLSSESCILKIRFPVPDLRPLHDMNRVPWWKRSVRPDFMTLKLNDAQIHTSIDSRFAYSVRHEIQCRQLLVTYTEPDSETPIEIAKASVDEKFDGPLQQDGEGFGWPRIVIVIYPKNSGGPLEESSEGEPESSLEDTLENTPRQQPSPFSSKRVIHESDTPHSKTRSQNDKNDPQQREGEELIIPGNRQEIMVFVEEATRTSRVQLDISLPCATVQIPSKHLYELLYNRINADLFLWVPSAPKPKYMNHGEGNIGLDFASTLLQESTYPNSYKFSMCKSGIQYDTDSESDEEGIFHSIAEKSNRHQHQEKSLNSGQSTVAVTLNIGQGLLTMYTPVRDSLQNVIPGQQGELIMKLEDALIFAVTSYKGDPNLSYISTIVKNVMLYQCGLTAMPAQTPALQPTNGSVPKHCLPVIYRCESGANVAQNSTEKDMLTVAVRVQATHQTHRIKTFRVAMGIRNATLMHRVCSSQTSWFTQLTDCLDVTDHPVAGYLPPGVLTEFYLHLWDCTIDYRPVYLPIRSMVTLGSFSICSNIAAQTNTSSLRFIAEEIGLFISDKSGNVVNLRNDYIRVMDLDLFDLSLNLNDKLSNRMPRVDLRASNNVLHVRTCSDSARALTQLLTYFASDGDLAPNPENVENVNIVKSKDEESLLGNENVSYLSKSQVERVNSLMEEAMEDTLTGTAPRVKDPSLERDTQVEVFFFPDESQPIMQSSEPQELDTDEEFCILGEDAGVGLMPKHGVPEVRWLSEEYLRVIDNHFSVPLGKVDELKAPKNFPKAVLSYTLCEMTLIWHMYGGKDFSSPQPVIKKHVTIDDGSQQVTDNANFQHRPRPVISNTVGFSRVAPNEVYFGSAPNSPRNKFKNTHDWQILGGPGRNHEILMELQLNKVRFRHEVYPENTTQASWQRLLISDIEIRDRLASSDINKFLYQYTSEAMPRQSHAYMFKIEAVHMRVDPKLTSQECCLKLSLLPLRLNIDQDSLLFLINFFTEVSDVGSRQGSNSSSNNPQSSPGSRQGTPTHHPPVMSVSDSSDNCNSQIVMNASQTEAVNQNLLILLEDEFTIKERKVNKKVQNDVQDDNQPLYFRSVKFSPEVLVKLDYHGRRIDLTHGPLAGLLLGLAQLNNSELKLKEISYRHGLLGADKLISYLLTEWVQDIKKNQLQSLLGGVGPMYSLIQLFQGIFDLFRLPIEQYQKDGRIVRGLQRGANSFTTSTAMAALELTSRLVAAIQSTAETAYDMVSPGPSVRCKKNHQKGGRRKRYYNQPIDIREGVANAYLLVKEGLGETATQLVRVASEEHEQKGMSGAVGGVLRQIPPTVVKPIILATEATSNVLGGMRSQLVPDARREAVQKWREEPADLN